MNNLGLIHSITDSVWCRNGGIEQYQCNIDDGNQFIFEYLCNLTFWFMRIKNRFYG